MAIIRAIADVPGGAGTGSPVTIDNSSGKGDDLIRQGMAAAILANTGLVIDPDDIYIPFG